MSAAHEAATADRTNASNVHPVEQTANQRIDVIGCDICGRAAEEGLWDWVSIGRFDMVCYSCAKATIAQAPNQWCDCCGTNKATQATADGSAACQTCGDNFSQMEGWLARAKRLCRRAIRRLCAPASRCTEEAARGIGCGQQAGGLATMAQTSQWKRNHAEQHRFNGT